MIKLAPLFFFLFSVGTTASQHMEMPLTAEDAIIMQEVEWAEKAMEGYIRKKGVIPIRSPIHAAHVHSEEWRQESINIFSQASKDFSGDSLPGGNLRGRNYFGSDR
jgi:hypothetical protein